MNTVQSLRAQDKHVITPAEFVELFLRLDSGSPFSFIGREYLKPIYNNHHPSIVIMSSRQAEKSTYIANTILMRTMLNLTSSVLYVSSRQSQVNDFVRTKINAKYENNLLLKRLYLSNKLTNRLSDKIFKNGAKLMFRSLGMNPVAIRGISAQEIYIDEVQSIDEKNVPIALECAHSFTELARYAFTGTPLSSKNYFTRLYNTTKQYEWIIRCYSCKKDNAPLGIQHIDLKKPFLFCQYCGKKINPTSGRWEAQNPNSSKVGYRLSRLMTPNARWITKAGDGILDKYKAYSEGQFFNEVLGSSYDSGSFVMKDSDVFKWCSSYKMIDMDNVPQGYKGTNQVMGIDWAWNNLDGTGSHTFVTIATKYSDKIKIIFAKRFDGPKYHNPETVLTEIAQLATKFSVMIIATDWGLGHKENYRLRNMVNAKVFEFMSTRSLTKSKWNPEVNTYMIGKTPTMSYTFEKIRTGLFEFPIIEQFKPYAQDILNIYSEMNPRTRTLRYESVGSDDFFQTLNIILQVFDRFNGV